MSPSKTHRGDFFLANAIKHCSLASCVDLLGRKPYAFGSALSSATGTKALSHNACIALSFCVGIESGLNFPDFLGMWIRLSGEGL